MPRIALNGATIHNTDTRGDGPAIVFSHGLLMSGDMFAAQITHFQSRYRCITFDHRRQGRSGATLNVFERTGHSSTIEAPKAVNDLIERTIQRAKP